MEVSTMARKTRSPEENERRAKIRELLQVANVSSMDDIQALAMWRFLSLVIVKVNLIQSF